MSAYRVNKRAAGRVLECGLLECHFTVMLL